MRVFIRSCLLFCLNRNNVNGKFPDPPSGEGGIGSGGSQVSATRWPDRDKMTWHLPFICVAIGKTQVAPKVICMYRLVCVCKDFQTKLCVVQEGDVARRGMEDVIARLKAHRQDLLPRLPGMWGAKYQATFKPLQVAPAFWHNI